MEQNGDEQMNRCEDWEHGIARQFLAECFVADDHGYTSIDEFFYLYDEWCTRQSIPTLSYIQILSAMETFGFRTYELQICSIEDEEEVGYHGIIPIWNNAG
jgi:hypothetical protein